MFQETCWSLLQSLNVFHATMPRFASLLQHRAVKLAPSRLTRPSCLPILSAFGTSISSRRTFASSSTRLRFLATPQRQDRYTPPRIPDAPWPYLYRQYDNMAPQLDSFFKQVDDLQGKFIERLGEAVAIPSISSEDHRRPDVIKVRSASNET